jgi:DNA-binding response OmpR family regulator
MAVSADSLREQLLTVLALDENDFDIIVVESIAHGYRRIKELMPHLIVVLLEVDDIEACQLLAMLRLDGQVAAIPVVTCVAGRDRDERDEIVHEGTRALSAEVVPAWMN